LSSFVCYFTNAELRAQMLAFIQSQTNIVERLLCHIETPAFVDLLVRIMQLDEHPSGAGVLEVRLRLPSVRELVLCEHQTVVIF
jgi:hypothetical protein